MKFPYLQLYVGDYLADNISGCSLAAQGLWIRMMFVMHTSERYGWLLSQGKPMSDEFVARKCGAALVDYRALLSELVAAGVPGVRVDGAIYSRRMVRDEENRKKSAERQQKHRKSNADVTPDVTALSHDKSMSLSVSENKPKDKRQGEGRAASSAAARGPDPALIKKAFPDERWKVPINHNGKATVVMEAQFVAPFDSGHDSPGGGHITPSGGKNAQEKKRRAVLKGDAIRFAGEFQKTYELRTKQPFKLDEKSIHVTNALVEKYGINACIAKAVILADLCEKQNTWFTVDDGWAAYSLGKMSVMWNQILPRKGKPPKEDVLRAERDKWSRAKRRPQ